MSLKKYQLIVFTAGILLSGCRKPFTPRVIVNDNHYLVVEGNIDPGADSTIIRLSRTNPVAAADLVQPELHARVTVESDDHTSYPLMETSMGYYVSPGLNLNPSNQYSLKITTVENESYQSDFLPVKNPPPLDSVYYKVESNGVSVYADTHDASNKTTYYRWQCVETYQIHSLYDSHYMHVKTPMDTVVNRPRSQQIYSCWPTGSSSTIMINSSEQLSRDVITKNKILFIPSNSEKIEDRYSVLVKQYALTKEAYRYWQQLKKNTEQLGGIFDPQPSDIPGNIHSLTVASEPVIGFISVGTYTQSRIYVDTHDLPVWRADTTYYTGCLLDSLWYIDPYTHQHDVKFYIYSDYDIPVEPFSDTVKKIIDGYLGQQRRCVDCTLRGPNKPPAFWKVR